MNTSASKKTTDKKATGGKAKELETEHPISEKDEVKKAQERTKKLLKGKH